jgi:hypothetical protein
MVTNRSLFVTKLGRKRENKGVKENAGHVYISYENMDAQMSRCPKALEYSSRSLW